MEFTVGLVRVFHGKKLYLVPPLLVMCWFLFSFFTRTAAVFPGLHNENIEAFDDSKTGGDSQIDFFDVDTASISMGYTLGDKIQYPYAGIKLVLKKGSTNRNLSAYDFFSVDLASKIPQNVNVYIHTIIPGFTVESNDLSYRYLLKTVKSSEIFKHFRVPLKSFAVPTWWFVLNKMPDDSLDAETFREVAEIIVESGYDNKVATPYSITLKKMSFHKNMPMRALVAMIVCSVWILLYSLFYLLYKNRINSHRKEVVISYEPIEVKNDSDEYLNKIVSLIAREYRNPDLTVKHIASEVGLLPIKITRILRETKNCSYKQYLNAIRIAEAKRLLLETDRNIVDIAGKVGYNNVTHFNRIFKDSEGISPGQFRSSASDKTM